MNMMTKTRLAAAADNYLKLQGVVGQFDVDEVETIEVKATLTVAGQYKFRRVKAVKCPVTGELVPGDVVEETGWCKNILTNVFFDAVHTSFSSPQGCVVGTGNAAPLETNTALQSFLVGTTTVQARGWTTNSGVSPRNVKLTKTWRFGAGVAAGNIAEAGVTWVSGSLTALSPVLSRALVVDGVGTPTTVTVLSDEFLDVVWEFTCFVPEDVAGGPFNMTIDGVVTPFTYTVRGVHMNNVCWGNGSTGDRLSAIPQAEANIGNYSPDSHSCFTTDAAMVAYTVRPTVTGANRVTGVVGAAYVAGSKQRSYTFTAGLNEANISIRSLFICNGTSQTVGLGAFQVLLNNPVVKVNTKVFNIVLTVSMANVP